VYEENHEEDEEASAGSLRETIWLWFLTPSML
jgi:hypothetical protein